MIKIKGLTRFYGDYKAVDDVSFEITRGEVVGLLGHNGAGKTTIMKMLTGYLEADSGDIEIDGDRIGVNTRAIQQRIGYLPENCPVWPEMTVIDYLEYQARLHGVAADKIDAAVARAIRRTALKEKAAQSIQTLSRGYRQRVGVAQAILHDPDIIILDEPTNGLDPTQIRQMRALIRELASSATVIISTHILQEVQASCDRVLIMRAGQLVVDSRLQDLQHSECLQLQVDNAEAASYLADIDGVTRVQPCPDSNPTHACFDIETDVERAPDIAAAVTAAGDRLYALQPEQQNLETLFAQVNAASEENVEEARHV